MEELGLHEIINNYIFDNFLLFMIKCVQRKVPDIAQRDSGMTVSC